jgi:hypothetical protein
LQQKKDLTMSGVMTAVFLALPSFLALAVLVRRAGMRAEPVPVKASRRPRA